MHLICIRKEDAHLMHHRDTKVLWLYISQIHLLVLIIYPFSPKFLHMTVSNAAKEEDTDMKNIQANKGLSVRQTVNSTFRSGNFKDNTSNINLVSLVSGAKAKCSPLTIINFKMSSKLGEISLFPTSTNMPFRIYLDRSPIKCLHHCLFKNLYKKKGTKPEEWWKSYACTGWTCVSTLDRMPTSINITIVGSRICTNGRELKNSYSVWWENQKADA